MEKRAFLLRRTGLLAVVCAVAMTALACTFALPIGAVADEAAVVAHSGEGDQRVNYTSVDDAVNAGYNGATIVMDADWSVGQVISWGTDKPLEIPAGKKLTIDMNGHTIKNAGEAITLSLGTGAELTLTSSKKVDIKYKGYSSENGSKGDYTVNAGGLVTSTTSNCCGIHVGQSAKLTLDGVAVAGCYGSSSSKNAFGGVSLQTGSTLNMVNGATVEHNGSYQRGGGVYAVGTNITVNMSNSFVRNNWAENSGGGIQFTGYGATLTMNDGASIEGNAAEAGGGVYFTQTNFSITSEDGKAYISNNKATKSGRLNDKFEQSGGGIHVDQVKSTSNKGLIEGITISGNYSAYDGGGIELDQEYVTIKNCTIKDNWCKYEGGGIYVCNDGNLIEDCTITGNACSVDSGGNYEGGGVFVWHSYDIKLKGVCVIKGNTRGKSTDNADDVMLRENAGGTAKAYITGSLSEGSSVGVRSGVTGDRRIAKNFSSENNDGLFIDLSGYYVSYGSDEGGDAWQRHTTKEFTAKINSEGQGKYRNGAAVTLVAPATKGDDKVFWYWDGKYTTGLNPVGDFITEKNMFTNTLAFTMPQNAVDATAVYATRATKVVIGVEAPSAGKALPSSAVVYRADGVGGTQPFSAAVTWYEVGKDGEKSDAAAVGVAKAGTAYVASVTCAQSAQGGLCFSRSFKAGGVTVKTPSGGDGPEAESASVDGATGSLTVVTKAFAETDGEKTEAKDEKATVKMVDGGLEAGLGGGSAEAAAVAALSDGGAEAHSGDRAVLGEFDVSWTEGDADVVIIAPAKAGYNFCNWEGALGSWERDDVLGTVTVPYDEVGRIDQLVAVYTPVVTSAAVGLDAPEAGKPLAETASDVKVTCSDAAGTEVSFAELLDADGFKVTWSPAGGTAGYSAAYTALVELAGGAEDLVDVEKVVSAGATVTCNGTAATAAGFTVVDGKLCLAVSFGETRAVTVKSVTQPEPVEVSFEDAAAGNWSLPKIVLVTLENGEVVDADVEWGPVEGFDANAAAAQELTVKGTITNIAYDGELDADDLDLNVSVTVKVAAPQKDTDDESDDKKDDGTTKTDTETTTTTTKTASKKGTPSTGDVTWGGFAGLLALAVVCLVAARLSLRKDR